MPDPDRQIWTDALAHLRAAHPTLARQWFDELEPLGVAAGTFRVRAHSAIHRDYLRRHAVDAFNEALQLASGRLIGVQFLGPEDAAISRGDAPIAANSPSHEEASRPGHRQHRDALAINPDNTFDHFVMGPGNRLAHAAALAVASNPGRAYNPLFIHGDVGLGKTHLLQAIALSILAAAPDANLYYTSCESFITQFMESVQAGEMTDFRHRFRGVDILVIDDVHFLTKRDRTQEEFFHTFNSLFQAEKQIVLSSDAPPEDIPDLEDRLVSRFKWGLVAKVDAPCFETRVQILKTKARLRGIDLPDEAACHVAAVIDSNIRELEGAITKLQIMAQLDRRPIDLELARAALGDPRASRPSGLITISIILSAVTQFYGVRVADLQSKRRHRSVALPRQVCMFLARRHTRHSLEEIGGYFGGRDHTTVMHAIKTVEEKSTADIEFKGVLSSLEESLRQAITEAG